MGRRQATLKPHCRGSHFTWDERLRLQYYWTGTNGYRKERSHAVLGRIFQKSPKTIKRELERGMVEHVLSDIPFARTEYNADHAQLDAEGRMAGKGPRPKSGMHHALVGRMSHLIRTCHYSPYAVLIRLDEEGAWPEGLSVCEKTVYNWIEAGDIPGVTIGDLPRKGALKRGGGPGGHHRRHSRVEFAARSIDKRPGAVADRREAGHWEGDTVYSTKDGSKECLLTLVERRTRLELVVKIPDRTAASVVKAFDRLERRTGSRRFRIMFKSVTFDNGSEFSDVAGLERSILTGKCRTSLYFAHPYCSSERGTNENHNGIIRRFLPKGTDFARVTHKAVREIQDWMNTYPRKILGGLTPLQAFRQAFGLDCRDIRLWEACL